MKKSRLITMVMVLIVLSTTAEAMFEAFWEYLVFRPWIQHLLIGGPADGGTSFAMNFYDVVCYNPPTSGILPFMTMLLRILIPIYSLSIVLIGFYLLFVSSSPRGRARAKSMLGKLIITMVLISSSSLLIDITFGISRELTESIFSLTSLNSVGDLLTHGVEDMWVMATWLKIADEELSLIPFILAHVFAWLPYIIISLRNIILTALMILFPLGILLYVIPSLKSIGKTILEQFLVWTFLQATMALALVCVVKAYSVTTLTPNPDFGGLNCWKIFCIPMGIPGIWTDTIYLDTFSFGMVAYAMITIFPIIIVMFFRKFLP